MTYTMDLTDEQIKKALHVGGKSVDEINNRLTQLEKDALANQEIFDKFASSGGDSREFKTVCHNIGKELWNKSEEKNIKAGLGSRDSKMDLQLKSTMLTSNSLGGGAGVNSYNQRLGIVPPQKVNMRDLIRVTPSPTGNFVTYRETNAVQVPGFQTEGTTKTNVQYEFTPTTTNSKYLACFVTVSKQLLFSANFMQQTLPVVLTRDYFKKENNYIYATIAANSSGTYTGSSTTDAEEALNTILSLRNANFDASFSIVDWIELGRILTTKPQDYSLPAGVTVDGQGNIRMLGTPIIGASFATSDKILTFDQSYYELLITEDLNVQFSYENQDNFEKNLVTIRIECFCELNRLRDDASVFHDLGNSA